MATDAHEKKEVIVDIYYWRMRIKMCQVYFLTIALKHPTYICQMFFFSFGLIWPSRWGFLAAAASWPLNRGDKRPGRRWTDKPCVRTWNKLTEMYIFFSFKGKHNEPFFLSFGFKPVWTRRLDRPPVKTTQSRALEAVKVHLYKLFFLQPGFLVSFFGSKFNDTQK